MIPNPLLRSLKAMTKAAAVLSVLAFGLQSVALPAHAVLHAVAHVTHATDADPHSASTPRLGTSDCDLCDLATHLSGTLDTRGPHGAIATIPLPALLPPVAEMPLSLRDRLPPVRGPPTRA